MSYLIKENKKEEEENGIKGIFKMFFSLFFKFESVW